jgi:hypothetical protein
VGDQLFLVRLEVMGILGLAVSSVLMQAGQIYAVTKLASAQGSCYASTGNHALQLFQTVSEHLRCTPADALIFCIEF